MNRLIRLGDWCTERMPDILLYIVAVLLAALLLVQIGIHKGRELEAREQAAEHTAYISGWGIK